VVFKAELSYICQEVYFVGLVLVVLVLISINGTIRLELYNTLFIIIESYQYHPSD